MVARWLCSIVFLMMVAAPGQAREWPQSAYGAFIRTFTFNGTHLPIVQPGESFILSDALVPPVNVEYVNTDKNNVGLIVPGGVYRVVCKFNIDPGASVSLFVNGAPPLSVNKKFPYTNIVSVTGYYVEQEYFVVAPREAGNLISLVNSGKSLLTLKDIPHTKIDNTSIITYVSAERLA